MKFDRIEVRAVQGFLEKLINGADAIHPAQQTLIEEYFEEYGRSTLLGCAIAGYFRVHEWVDRAEVRRVRRLEKQILEAKMPSGNTFGEGSVEPVRIFSSEEMDDIYLALDADPAFDEPHPKMDLIMEYYRVMGNNPLTQRITEKFPNTPWIKK